MYIREMCLDGFKSYGNRVDIRGFDRMFNAITGLNGSGKSNILDAICFVLGISNLQHVRAGNLQDLVYKFGQAGITKASVSITFDNTDKATSPIGYENVDEIVVTRQVVVGGKNRYLINGLNINNKRIQDLFRSVQLNVNNPTFLIMQGRITKVLNMKSQEILGMIEEAAGTKMYENKKITALTTIDKKNAKLREIDQILIDTINPTIEKLKQERNAYLEYQNTQRTLVHLRRVHVLHSYVHLQSAANEESKKRDDLKGDLDGAEERIRGCDGRIEEADKNIEEIEQKREEDEPTQKLNALSNALKDKERVETSLESDLKGVKETVKDDEKRLATLKKTLQKEEKTLEDREKSQGSTAENWERLKAQMEADEAALQAAQVKVEQASRGNMAGDETSLRSQLDQAQAELTQAKSSVAQAGVTIPSLRSAIKKKEDESKRTKGDYDRSAVSSQKLSAEIEQMQRKMMSMNYDEAAADQLQNQRDNLERDLRRLRDYVNSFDDRYPRFAFTFNDPYRNFDRGQVHGVIAKLFTVREQRFMQAIEICAGGRLFNVVLESEQVGKDLLARGRLSRRVTFVPLNRISYHMIDQRTVDNARRAAGSDRIWRAIDLVEFDPRFEKALKWLLGSQLISETMEDAKKVAFDPRVMRRCITLEGDVFDPSGTMSGGARERGSDLLMITNEFRAHEAELRQKEVEMRRIDETVGSPEVARQYRVMKDALELKNYELTAMKQRLANTDHQRLLAEIEELRTTLKEQEDIVAQSQDNQKQIAEKIKTLDYKLKNLDKLRDLAIKEAKKELQECEKRAKASAAKAQSFEQEAQQYVVEMEAAKKEIEDLKAKIAELEAKIVEGQGKLPAIEDALEGAKVETNKVKQDMKELKEKIAATDREIQRLQNEKKEALKKKNELKLKVQKLEIDYKAAEDKCAMQDDQISKLMSEYTWLRDEAQKYQDGTSSFEITSAKTRDIERQLVKLEEKEKQLSRHVNVKAMNMLGHMEEKFNSLVKKKDQVESDKKKIQRFIDDLDKKKNDVLTKAHEQVNRDFGSIFSELLPGARAKLVPPKGQTVLDGLEVKVAFGEAWKESLAELSGGQRSLVALSLILAILLFKPAPLYILDEVDAALDLSHTQNIGSMLRKHFRHSQFIVVSLKEGMFSNANVLFKTRFVDGMSTVNRTQNANAMRPLSPSPERDLDKRGKRQNQQQQAPKA